MKNYSFSLTAFIILLIFPLTALGEVFYIDTDNVGSPVAMWDAKGKKVWDAEYLPFGEEFTTTKSPQDNKNRFIGKEKDKETGLTYFGARYFDERSGRFLTPDPVRVVDPFTSKTNYEMLENPQRLNRYAYGLNNPYRYVDPDGEFAVVAAALAGAAIAYFSAPDIANSPESSSTPTFESHGAEHIALGAVGGLGVRAVGSAVGAYQLSQGASKKGLGNPFKNKTAEQIDETFTNKGFTKSGPDPAGGTGGYVNPKTGRSYHIDPKNWGKHREPNHVDVNRPRGYKGPLDKKKLPYMED